MNKGPKFSIIVPVYNVERYLSRCLQSLIDQTLHDIEIICVNDGSTDGSLSVLEKYKEIDDRITIINKENGGLPSARNAGIDVAEGEYYLFVDSDDYISENACDRLYLEARQTGADIIIFGTRIFPEINKEELAWYYDTLTSRQINYRKKSIEALFKEKPSKPFVWNGCYKGELFTKKGLRFDEEMRYGEDMVFLFEVFPLAKEISYIPDMLYNYRCERKDSLMGTISKDFANKLEWHLKILNKIFSNWEKNRLIPKYSKKLGEWALDFMYYDLTGGKLEKSDMYRIASDFMVLLDRYGLSGKGYNLRHQRMLWRLSGISKKKLCIPR